MRTPILVFFFLLVIFSSNSQVVKEANVRLFSLVEKGDTISFLKTDTCLTKKKPTILFCQGSMPIPMVIVDSKGPFIPYFNFDYRKLSDRYNIIVISMPHTPTQVKSDHLNKKYEYITDTIDQHSYDPLYLRDNYLEKYVERAEKVIDFLKKQKWVDITKIAVFGHSQGSYIAAKLAARNKSIKALGYSGGNPDGRFTQYIRSVRRAVLTKKISAQEAQNSINDIYETWSFYCKGIDKDSIGIDNVKSWKSFTYSAREELAKMKTPIYVAYGAEDLEHAESCDLLPIYFERAGKTNYKMMPLVGCGHNFEEISPEGMPNWDKMHWDDVMNGFIEWWESLKE